MSKISSSFEWAEIPPILAEVKCINKWLDPYVQSNHRETVHQMVNAPALQKSSCNSPLRFLRILSLYR